MITLDSISKTYGTGESTVTALKDVSLEIDDGDFVAIMGPSGSGKTTLLTILGALNPPSTGRIVVDGVELQRLSGDALAIFRRDHLGFVFQQHQLMSYLTAVENVMVPLAVCSNEGSRLQMARGALRSVGLENKATRLPGQLSGGEQSRVAIARAIVNNPRIILADEPTGNLDSRTGEEIMHLLTALNQRGHTILLVTHNIDAAQFARRLVFLKDGTIAGEENTVLAASVSAVDRSGNEVAAPTYRTGERASFRDGDGAGQTAQNGEGVIAEASAEELEEEDENEWIIIGLIVLVTGLVLGFVLFVLQNGEGTLHIH